MTRTLRRYEAERPEKCGLIPSEDQFYAFSKGTNRLSRHGQWVYVPAVKDATFEQVEARNSALGSSWPVLFARRPTLIKRSKLCGQKCNANIKLFWMITSTFLMISRQFSERGYLSGRILTQDCVCNGSRTSINPCAWKNLGRTFSPVRATLKENLPASVTIFNGRTFLPCYRSLQGRREDAILRRLLGCGDEAQANGTHDARDGGVYDSRNGVWVREDTGDWFSTLNQLNESIISGNENVWNENWKYRTPEGPYRSIDALRS